MSTQTTPFSEETRIKNYWVIWLQTTDGKKFDGVCMRSRRIFVIRDSESFLPLLVVTHVVTDNAGCSDEEWCLNTKCELCKTTRQSLIKSHMYGNNITEDDFEHAKKFVEDQAETIERLVKEIEKTHGGKINESYIIWRRKRK